MKFTRKNKHYGKVEIPADALVDRNAKFRVTMFIDLDVLKELRKKALSKSLPYQTYINQLLREQVFGDNEKRIREIVKEELAKKSA